MTLASLLLFQARPPTSILDMVVVGTLPTRIVSSIESGPLRSRSSSVSPSRCSITR